MKQAGINPILAGGQPASQPMGNAASASQASTGQEQAAENPMWGVLKAAIGGMTAVATARSRAVAAAAYKKKY